MAPVRLGPVRPLRLDPPPLPDDPALAWALKAAFAPERGAVSAIDRRDRLRAARWARRLGLQERIAARTRRDRLEATLGQGAIELVRAQRLASAQGVALLDVAAEVAAVAAAIGVPVLWLKFAGLVAAGRDVVGRRGASDVDLLVPEERGAELLSALLAGGFVRAGTREPPHQFATLVRAPAGVVDLHRYLPMLSGPGRRGRRFGELERDGLLAPAVAIAAGTWVPVPALAAAHAAVHVLEQHPFVAGYPHLRAVGDLLDLGLGGATPVTAVAALASGAVAPGEIEALAELAAALARGERPSSGRAALWLAHFVALASIPEYATSLRLRAALRGTGEGSTFGLALGRLRRLLFLTAAEVEAIHGPQRGRAAIVARQLARPFDLVVRSWVALAARRQMRRGAGAGASDLQGRDGETSGSSSVTTM